MCTYPQFRRNVWSVSNHQLTRCVSRAFAVVAAGVLLIAPSALSHGVPSASADDCPDVEVTFARGTDEPTGIGRAGQGLVDALREQTGMNIGVYAVNYKATLFQLHTDDGSKDAVAHIKSMADKCPNTLQVLGGYSQGASVVDIVAGNSVGGLLRGTTLPAQYAKNVAAVVTFGNIAGRTNHRYRPRVRCSVPRRWIFATPATRSVTQGLATNGTTTPRATCPSTPIRRRAS